MQNIYKECKNHLKKTLGYDGFKSVKYDEGLYKAVSDDVLMTFSISGVATFVDIYSGLRFNKINAILERAAILAEWPARRQGIFNLELAGLFSERLYRYHRGSENIKSYSPPKSVVGDIDLIANDIAHERTRLMKYLDMQLALEYTLENKLYEPYGSFMIPVASRLMNNKKIWDWSVNFFREEIRIKNSNSIAENIIDYDGLIDAVESII